MKVGIEQAPSEFKPITLTISFETKKEFDTFKEVVDLPAAKIGEIANSNIFDISFWQLMKLKIWKKMSEL